MNGLVVNLGLLFHTTPRPHSGTVTPAAPGQLTGAVLLWAAVVKGAWLATGLFSEVTFITSTINTK